MTLNSLTLAAAMSASIELVAPASASMWTAVEIGTTLKGNYTIVSQLNGSGQVVGHSQTADASYVQAFMTGMDATGMTGLGMASPLSGANGINSSGQVVGSMTRRAFITGTNGMGMTGLGTLGGDFSSAVTVNDRGQVAGGSTTADGAQHAFVWGVNGTAMRDLGTLGGTYSSAYGINAGGQVVGISSTAGADVRHAFITDGNGVGMRDLGTLGGRSSGATSINDKGQVVGSSSFSDNDFLTHAFITGANGLGMSDLGTLGGALSAASDINAGGQVVGSSNTAAGALHAFVTGANGEGMVDLNSLVSLSGGGILYEARGINDAGQIVANATNGRAYLITPTIPEPGSYVLMLLGFGLTGVAVRNRRGARACARGRANPGHRAARARRWAWARV